MRKKRPVIVKAAAQMWPRALSEDPLLSDFKPAGKYFCGRFALDDAWRRLRGVYVWCRGVEGGRALLRVGVACGKGGFGARYASYNRWLAGKGRFGTDARERAVAHFTKLGLGDHAEIWARACATRLEAELFEQEIRALSLPTLDLDLAAPNSWIARRMILWRHSAKTTN